MNNLQGISFVIARYREDNFQRCVARLRALGVQDIIAIKNANSIYEAYDYAWPRAKFGRICFLHEDAEIEGIDETFVHQFLSMPDTGLLGIAGTRYLNEDAVWWHGSGKDAAGKPQMLSGMCRHPSDDNIPLCSVYGAHGQVVALDGVCLFADLATLESLNGFTDAPLHGFDFYDISISIRATLAGLKNYTIPMDIFHWGLGAPRGEWEQNRKLFLAKYGNLLPLTIDNLKLSASG